MPQGINEVMREAKREPKIKASMRIANDWGGSNVHPGVNVNGRREEACPLKVPIQGPQDGRDTSK